MFDAEQLQRRWFAALLATRRVEAECLQLLDTLRGADEAWRRACTELAALETLRDALEEQLTGQDEMRRPRFEPPLLAVISAA
jgi:hypothetical protein